MVHCLCIHRGPSKVQGQWDSTNQGRLWGHAVKVAGWGPSEREGFLPHLESRPVITSIQLVLSGAQNGKREGESKQAAHLQPATVGGGGALRGLSQEWTEFRGIGAHRGARL